MARLDRMCVKIGGPKRKYLYLTVIPGLGPGTNRRTVLVQVPGLDPRLSG